LQRFVLRTLLRKFSLSLGALVLDLLRFLGALVLDPLLASVLLIVLRQTSASPGTWPVIEVRCACTNRFLLACIVRKLPAMRHRT
jgi:hypothetical protein